MSERPNIVEYTELSYIDTGMFASSEDFPTSPSTGFRWCHPRRIYRGDELISYQVPCRRLTDGAVGYYDIINDQFYRLRDANGGSP